MKIRVGFVSNSSSSSFIISSFEKPKLTIEVDIEELSESIIDNKEKLDEYFLDYYDYKTIEEMLADGDPLKKEYEKCLTELQLGSKIYIGQVSSDSYEPIENLLYNSGLSGKKNFEVIQDVSS
jgi:hypothetical protein